MDVSEQLHHIEQIKQLKARYLRLMDAKLWDEWREVFTEDCVMRLGSDGAITLEGRTAIVARAREQLADRVTVHQGHMPEIELLSDTQAVGRWSLHAVSVHAETGGDPSQSFTLYEERYRRHPPGPWQIAEVTLRSLLRVTEDAPAMVAMTGPASGVVVSRL